MNPKNAGRPVFDASAVLALMQGEPGTDKLRDLQPNAVVNAVNAAEVLAKLVSRGLPAAEAQAAYDALHLETTPFDPAMVAAQAGRCCAPLRSRPATCARVYPWETDASWLRRIGTGPDGLRIEIWGRYSEAAFRL